MFYRSPFIASALQMSQLPLSCWPPFRSIYDGRNFDGCRCGGIGETCPLVNQKACTDAQYMDCAYESSRCVRLSKFFWQVHSTVSEYCKFRTSVYYFDIQGFLPCRSVVQNVNGLVRFLM